MKRKIIPLLLILTLVCPIVLKALTSGEYVTSPVLRDAEDRPAKIPFMGKKNLLLFYIDPNVHDQNDAFIKTLSKEIKSPPAFQTIAIINLRDAPLMPDSIVRYMLRREIKKTGGTILTDPKRILRESWKLGECNEQFVVILLDTKNKVRFIKKGKLNSAETEEVLDLIRKLTAEKKSTSPETTKTAG